MPSRILREGILTSERINALSADAELFYRRVMSVVDDFGRFSGNPRLLRASCYPLRLDEVRETAIQGYMDECAEAGLLLAYVVGGKPYIELLDFKQQIRAKDSKYPAPEVHMQNTCVADAKQLQASVHLGEGGDVVECEGGSESAARAVTAVDLSIAMRKGGVQSQPADPRLIALAEQGVTPETVAAACEEAKRSKPNETIGIGYVAKILERWAKDAADLKARGAAAPQKQGAWWATDSTILAKGAELGLRPGLGESMQTFKGRIQIALDNAGKPPAARASPPATVMAAEPKRVEVPIPPELKAKRSEELKAAMRPKTQ
jgi:hypothetical protein